MPKAAFTDSVWADHKKTVEMLEEVKRSGGKAIVIAFPASPRRAETPKENDLAGFPADDRWQVGFYET